MMSMGKLKLNAKAYPFSCSRGRVHFPLLKFESGIVLREVVPKVMPKLFPALDVRDTLRLSCILWGMQSAGTSMDGTILGGAYPLSCTVVCFSVPSRTLGTMESGCGTIMGLASVGACNSDNDHRGPRNPRQSLMNQPASCAFI